MERTHRETINRMLVQLFNEILSIEEGGLRVPEFNDLSMREFHVIETVAQSGESNTMSVIAAALRITVGSLTVAIATLERKGYVIRQRSELDRRRVHVSLTPRGVQVNEHHAAFHREMTDAVMHSLPEDELEVLVKALRSVDDYFTSKEKQEA